MSIIERIKAHGLKEGHYAVFGSALLDLWGIRPAKDLDIIVTPELFEELRVSSDWKEVSANGFELLRKGDADVTTLQDKPTDKEYCPDRLKLIQEAVIIKGAPFVRIEEVIACKTAYDREKDRLDIKNINLYIKSCGDSDIYAV